MFIGSVDENLFSENMERIKKFNSYFSNEVASLAKYKEKENKRIKNRIKSEGLAGVIINTLYTFVRGKKHKNLVEEIDVPNSVKPNYFIDKRIAIYTVLFGNYDDIKEPVVLPNNCDFYIITDQTLDKKSVWRKIPIEKYSNTLNGMSNTEKNRYFKMHPDILFPNYDYSIYIDASIMPITDLTEYVNSLNTTGIGFFIHAARKCVYDEIEACMFWGKFDEKTGNAFIEYLKSQKMPLNYGLVECGFIVRRHHSSVCKNLMDDWWNEFQKGPKRDQLTLPLCLVRNNILIEDIVIPGGTIYTQRSFKLLNHI